MPIHVPESLFEHLLLENAEVAKEIFSTEEGEEYEINYQEFADNFKETPEFLGKFAEWAIDNDTPLSTIENIYDKIIELKNKNISIDINPEDIKSPKQFLRDLNTIEKEDENIEKEEDENTIKTTKKTKSLEKTIHTASDMNQDLPIEEYTLDIYDLPQKGFACLTEIKNNEALNIPGQGLYVWTNLSFLEKGKDITYKFGQYGAQAAEGTKTPVSTINSYVGATADKIVLLYAIRLDDYLQSDKNDHRFQNAYEIEQVVGKILRGEAGGYKVTDKGKSTELFGGITLKNIIETINEVIYSSKRLNNYNMRAEQQTAHDQIVDYFQNKGDEFLLAAKMRYGKNFTVLNVAKTMEMKNILVLTYKPHVFNSLRDDVTNHVNFEGWEFIDIKQNRKPSPTSEKTRIFASSAQLAQYKNINESKKEEEKNADKELEQIAIESIKAIRKNLKNLSDIHFDMIIADEYHYGTSTNNFNDVLRALNYDKIIYVSGTAMKDIAMRRFDHHQIFSWSYTDEQREKKNGSLAHKDMPTMNMKLIHISDEAKDEIKSIDYSSDEQFNMEKVIGVNNDGSLKNPGFFEILLKQIAGTGVRKEMSPFAQTENLNHTFWVLPKNTKGIKAMADLMEKMPEYEDYMIIPATGSYVTSIDTVKEKINEAEAKGKRTITLSCYRFKEGVTVPEWNGVLMLDGGKSLEEYMQAIFRCQSPDPRNNKQNCYIFDFNPQRALQMIYDSCENVDKKGESKLSETIKEFLDYAPVQIQRGNKLEDVSFDEIIENFRVYGSFSEKFANSKNINIEKIDEDIINSLHNVRGEKRGKTFEVNDNEVETGKTAIQQRSTTGDSEKDEEDPNLSKQSIKKYIEKIKTVLSNIPEYLFNSQENEETVDDIIEGSDSELFEDITGVSIEDFTYWAEKGLINKVIFNRNIKYFLDAESEFFNSNPTLKEKENFFRRHFNMKAESGATPSDLVNEMLDKLPTTIWEDPSKTFCDLVMGTGTFLLGIKERLMEGLSDKFKDPQMREEHILKNMIWGVDINRSKTLIANKLINNNNLENNLMNKDSLKLNWNDMPKFDVVVGNPPFQSEKEAKGNTGRIKGLEKNLYQKFIDLGLNILKDGGYISLITPPGVYKSTEGTKPNKYFQKLNSIDILHIKLNGLHKYFKVGSPLTYFLARKTKTNNKTTIESFDTIEKDISKDLFIPSSIDKYTYSILEKMKNPIAEGTIPSFKRTGSRPNGDFICIKGMNNRSKSIDARLNPEKFSGADLIWETPDAKNIVDIYNYSPFLYLIRRLYYDPVIYFGTINSFKIPKNTNKKYTENMLYEFYGFSSEEIESIENFKIYYLI